MDDTGERKRKKFVVEIDPEIVERYDTPGPRYTSYPPANLFREGFSGEDYLERVVRSNREGSEGISLYIHVPFCPRLCHFCGCNTEGRKDRAFIERYFDALLTEIGQVSEKLDQSRLVTQVHWGGGTPNSVEWEQIGRVMGYFRDRFRFMEDAEIAMECNPAYLEISDVNRLAEMGFNRVSLGIQDFSEEVLRIINRSPSRLPAGELVEEIRRRGIGVNLDFVYGLPGQTLDGYLDTLRKAVDIRPRRLVTFSYAHVPWVKKAQKILEKAGLPSPEEKLQMLVGGYELLTGAGYQAIGMDHFALPEDEMSKAFRSHSLHRNFQGYCTRKHTGQVYAFGASAISQLNSAYFQNAKEALQYMESLEKGVLPVVRGYLVDQQEKVVRQVINQIMCNGTVDLGEEAAKLEMSPQELRQAIGFKREDFRPLIEDGLVELTGDTIWATTLGMLLVRVIARKLDPAYTAYRQKFSRVI